MSMGRGTFCGPSRSPETPFSRWPRAEALATAAPVEPEPERGDVEPSGISRHLTTLTVARPYARRREWG